MNPRRSWKLLAISVLLLSLGCCALSVVTLLPVGLVDYPCFAHYNAESACMQVDMVPNVFEAGAPGRIQAFLSIQDVRLSGGGCRYESSATDRLDVSTQVLPLHFERRGDRLTVNGKDLGTGEKFQYTKFWNLNPWTIQRIEFTNHGLLPDCQTGTPSLYISGSYGSQISPVKAGIAFVIAILIFLAYFRLVFSHHGPDRESPET